MSPTLFNMAVENFIRIWLAMTVEDHKVANNGLGESVWCCLGIFCDDDVMVVSRDLDWLQHSMNVLVSLFLRYGLATNVTKSHSMACQPGAVWLGMSAKAKALKCTGVVYLYHVRLR